MVAPNLRLSKVKTGFFSMPNICLSMLLFHAYFGQWGHIFCTKWLDTKIEIDQASKPKKHFDLVHKSWQLVVSTSSTCHIATHQTQQPFTQVCQILCQMIGLILVKFCYFIKFLKMFSKKNRQLAKK